MNKSLKKIRRKPKQRKTKKVEGRLMERSRWEKRLKEEKELWEEEEEKRLSKEKKSKMSD